MAHTIAFTHFKGGTGKTTSCLSVAGFLAKHGAKVLAIDLDPQANLTSGMGVDNIKARRSMHHVMDKKSELKDIIVETPIDNLDLAPASYQLAHATLRSYKTKKDALILKNAIEELDHDYEFILLDLPPSNGHFIVNGVIASDSTILVLDPGQFSLEGIKSFKGGLSNYCKKLGYDIGVDIAIVNKCAASWNPFRKARGKRVAKQAEKLLDTKVFTIPLRVSSTKASNFTLQASI
jgi:chromosome partitioning protein